LNQWGKRKAYPKVTKEKSEGGIALDSRKTELTVCHGGRREGSWEVGWGKRSPKILLGNRLMKTSKVKEIRRGRGSRSTRRKPIKKGTEPKGKIFRGSERRPEGYRG